jgi:hypothetical protein
LVCLHLKPFYRCSKTILERPFIWITAVWSIMVEIKPMVNQMELLELPVKQRKRLQPKEKGSNLQNGTKGEKVATNKGSPWTQYFTLNNKPRPTGRGLFFLVVVLASQGMNNHFNPIGETGLVCHEN